MMLMRARRLQSPGLGLSRNSMIFEPVRYFLRIKSDGAMNAVVRDMALLGQPIDMLYGPTCGFRNDLGGDKLSQACGQLYYFGLFLRFRNAVLI
jgi:hypothetical protein